ncbi:MarR family transcriptional regulator [Candidatus Pacearchaeota archaeon CG10_big_fil_rev_8_21_14_0_10_32_42]|nr:MAG: MarR family transcriptional regulator [Candidatus Pacearchaeota archaeon CG10_big_fil_rev_8_21_14_0_10_32_42]
MIDFACKKFDMDEIIKCVLGLSKSEFKLLRFLSENDDRFTTDKLSTQLKLDKSTIQRSIKKLHEKSLVTRSQINQSIGGYVFLYRIKDKEKVRQVVSETVDNWVSTLKKNISVGKIY